MQHLTPSLHTQGTRAPPCSNAETMLRCFGHLCTSTWRSDLDTLSTDLRADTNQLYRRKYFSPKERMHIAQQAAKQMRKRQSVKGSWLAPPTPTSPVRPSTSAGTLSHSTPSLISESKVSLIQADQTVISEDQARWFLMLPDKVRKQHFSREEQVALMMRCKKALEHVSPEMAADVYRRILAVSREDRSPSFTKTRPSTSGETPFDDG